MNSESEIVKCAPRRQKLAERLLIFELGFGLNVEHRSCGRLRITVDYQDVEAMQSQIVNKMLGDRALADTALEILDGNSSRESGLSNPVGVPWLKRPQNVRLSDKDAMDGEPGFVWRVWQGSGSARRRH